MPEIDQIIETDALISESPSDIGTMKKDNRGLGRRQVPYARTYICICI